VAYPIVIAGYYLLIYIVLKDNGGIQIPLMAVNAALTTIVLVCWFAAEIIDPEARPGKTGIPVLCFSPPEKSARYCGTCKKMVLGLDHHCSWLNTCIGRRNYVPFISLVFVGLAQTILFTFVGVAAQTIWLHEGRARIR
jgi:palmitoyltransferase